MRLKETSHLLWTCKAWERVKFGSMGKVLADIGQHLLMVNATVATMPEHSAHLSVNLGAANLPKDGKYTKMI